MIAASHKSDIEASNITSGSIPHRGGGRIVVGGGFGGLAAAKRYERPFDWRRYGRLGPILRILLRNHSSLRLASEGPWTG